MYAALVMVEVVEILAEIPPMLTLLSGSTEKAELPEISRVPILVLPFLRVNN